MNKATTKPILLSVIELGGYPNFAPIYESAGYEVVSAVSVRRALGAIKQRAPDAIVAEFNFQSDFRDRTSSLESVFSVVQTLPGTKVVVFYDAEQLHHHAGFNHSCAGHFLCGHQQCAGYSTPGINAGGQLVFYCKINYVDLVELAEGSQAKCRQKTESKQLLHNAVVL